MGGRGRGFWVVGVGTGRSAEGGGARGGMGSLFFYLGWGWSRGQRKLLLLGIFWRGLPLFGRGVWVWLEVFEEGRDPEEKGERR